MTRAAHHRAAFVLALTIFPEVALAAGNAPSPPPASPTPAPASPPAPAPDSEPPASFRPAQGPLHHPHPPQKEREQEKDDYTTKRYEPAGLPLVGGDSDIGFEFGAVGTLSYFADGVQPYRWNMDLLLSASVKQGPNGLEIAQQNYLWQLDAPGLFGGGVRLNPEASYNHTINYGYFGVGNASKATPAPASDPLPGRYYEWIDSFVQVRSSARVAIRGPWAAEFAAQYLYVSPTLYEGSKLAQDAVAKNADGSPAIYGTRPLSKPSLAAGFAYDSRDDEIFPHAGFFHEVGVRFEQGIPFDDNVRYAEAGAILRGYVPLVGPLVLAGRLVANLQFGDVPFYDLFQAGPFDQKEMPGGSAGIRGVPVGRYLGPIKLVGNLELRAMLVQFELLGQRFTVGDTLFFDTGRVWSDYSFRSPLDGNDLGLKFGVGGGVYLLWGQAAMLRVECAYSPDAVSENASLPVGIYVEDGVMF